MSKTINRISELISQLNISARQFDLSIGTANGYILRMQKNNASVGSDVIERIAEQYPNINLEWLIMGKGSMFIESNNESEFSEMTIDRIIEEKISAKLRAIDKKSLLEEIQEEINNLNIEGSKN